MRVVAVMLLAACGRFSPFGGDQVHPDAARRGDAFRSDGLRFDGGFDPLPDATDAALPDGATVVTFVAVADAWVTNATQQMSRQNFGADTVIRGGGIDRNGFLRFDLTSLPPTTTVLAGELDLYAENDTAGADFDRMLEPWDEGALVGSNGTCNWTERQAGVAWNQAGGGRYYSQDDGNYIATATATAQAPISASFDVRAVALVQDWVANPATNYGLGFVTVAGYFSFYSRESAHPPTLKLTVY